MVVKVLEGKQWGMTNNTKMWCAYHSLTAYHWQGMHHKLSSFCRCCKTFFKLMSALLRKFFCAHLQQHWPSCNLMEWGLHEGAAHYHFPCGRSCLEKGTLLGRHLLRQKQIDSGIWESANPFGLSCWVFDQSISLSGKPLPSSASNFRS